MTIRALYDAAWHQRWSVAAILASGALFAFTLWCRIPTSYTATSSVLMVPASIDAGLANAVSTTRPLLSDDLPMLAQTSAVMTQASASLGGQMSPRELATHVRAQVYQSSNVMTIRFVASKPGLAVDGANSVADAIVAQYRILATSRFDSLAADIRRQLAQRQQALRQLDARIELNAARGADVQSDDGRGSSLGARLARFEDEREELQAKLAGDASQAAVTSQRMTQAVPLARQEALAADPLYRELREAYGRDTVTLAAAQEKYTPEYPGLSALQATVDHERSELARVQQLATLRVAATVPYTDALVANNQARSLVADDRARLEQFNRSIQGLVDRLYGSSSGAADVLALKRERQSQESAYQLLSMRLITALADRAAAASTGSVMVFNHAVYAAAFPLGGPVASAFAVMMIAVWVAISLALLLEKYDRRFRTPTTIEHVYGVPVLEVVA